MTEKEFCLSENGILDNEVPKIYYWEEDVREFIRLLKEELIDKDYYTLALEIIDKLAGEKLK